MMSHSSQAWFNQMLEAVSVQGLIILHAGRVSYETRINAAVSCNDKNCAYSLI